jgi:hypothetical protein
METTTVAVKANEEEKVLREYTEEELTRTFTISEECYANLMEMVSEAESRGLNTSAQFWLESQALKHFKVTQNLWKKADDTSMFTRAQRGNVTAKLAVLASLGVKGEEAKKLLGKL